MKKILATILSVAMLLSTMGFAVMAEDVAVAEIDGVTYNTLQAAFDNVKDGETITLLGDIVITSSTAGL